MKNNGMCQMVTQTAIIAVAASGVRVLWSLGWAKPRKLGSSISWAAAG